jgi:hypothetical protein
MPKIKVTTDSTYPTYCITAGFGVPVTLTDKELAYIKRAEKMYDKAQGILCSKYHNTKAQKTKS